MKRRVFDYSFLAIGLLVQVITFWIANRYLTTTNHQPWLSLLSGCLGICSVCLASQGNILTYAFGFAQVGTYMILVIANRLLGQVALNVFYLITMVYGVYVWRGYASFLGLSRVGVKHMDRQSAAVLGCIYINTCTCGAGIDDSCFPRTLVHLARGRYIKRDSLAAGRGLLHGRAVYLLVR